jgi:hypothetical protein
MEKYINIDTLAKNDINDTLKDLVICPLCSNILIDPYMCMKCLKVYCKKCIDEWKNKEKDDKCPNKCEKPNYQKSLDKNGILSKLKFVCTKCESDFLYEGLIKHIDNCKGERKENKTNNIIENKRTKRMKQLTKNEADHIRKKEKKYATNIKSKIYNSFNIFFN